MKRLLIVLALCSPAFASTQFFLTTQVPTEAGAYGPCATDGRGLHAQRGAGVTTSVTTTASGGTDIATTATAGGNELCFISDPVLATTSIAASAGSVTFNIWGFESATTANCTIRVKVYKYDGATETLIVDATNGAEITVNAAINFTGTPSATTLNAGDRLVIRTRITNAGGTMASGRSFTMNYSGTTAAASGDSYVTFTENIPLKRTRTVKAAAGDYTTLAAWEAGERGILPTLLEARQAELYAIHDTAAVNINAVNWTTSGTYFIRIYTDATARHAGVWDITKYYIDVSTAGTSAVLFSVGNLTIEGLQIQETSAAAGSSWGIRTIVAANGDNISIHHNIIKGVFSSTANSGGVWLQAMASVTATANVYNNIIYNFSTGTAGFGIYADTGWTANAYNNTAYNNVQCYYRAGTSTYVVKNSAAMSCGDGFVGTFGAASDYNASDVAADAPGANSHNGSAATFVNAAGGNFKPDSADTVLNGAGLTDPGSGLFADDITGTTRSVPWDIGAFIATPASSPHPHTLTTLGVGF